jgi:phage terminase small subunit
MQRLTEKQELFAQGLSRGLTQAAAYREAGFKPDDANSTRLAHRPHIVQRVLELKAELAAQEPEPSEVEDPGLVAVAAGKVTRETYTAQLDEQIRQATAKGQFSAVAALMVAKGKANALLVQELVVSEKNIPLDKLLADLVAAGLPEAIARRKLGFPVVNVIPLPTKRA